MFVCLPSELAQAHAHLGNMCMNVHHLEGRVTCFSIYMIKAFSYDQAEVSEFVFCVFLFI